LHRSFAEDIFRMILEGVRHVLKPKELEECRRVIEETLIALGRDDVGVGDVAEKTEGMLAVALSRGAHTQTVEVPIDALRGKEQARTTISRAIFGLSKAIEKETMETAERLARE
jgi:hypothetical protein